MRSTRAAVLVIAGVVAASAAGCGATADVSAPQDRTASAIPPSPCGFLAIGTSVTVY